MSNEFGEALRHLRQSRGLRQVDLETAGSWYSTFISALEVGRRRPKANTLLKLAELLDADVEWLRGLQQAKPRGPVHPPDMIASLSRWQPMFVGLALSQVMG